MSVIGSYFLYYTVVLFTSATVYFSEILRERRAKSISKLLFWLSVILPIVIAGFRYGIGTDYYNYESIYNQLTNGYYSLFDLISNTRFEPGWIALNLFVEYVFGDVKYVFLLSSLLTWFIFFKAIYNQKDKVSMSIAVLILLCTMYNLSFNSIRQPLATSFLMLSITPLLNRKLLRFLILVFLGSCFHYTSLIFLPVYWIVNSKNEKIGFFKKAITPVLFILLIVFINPILSYITSFELFSAYSSYDLRYDSLGFGNIILRLPVLLIVLLNVRKLKLKHNPIHKIAILYFINIILLYLGYFAPYVGRIAEYFEITQVLILGAIVKVQSNKYEKFIYSYVIIIYYLAMFTYKFLILGYHETIPYQWITW